jgi:hypothetical protein
MATMVLWDSTLESLTPSVNAPLETHCLNMVTCNLFSSTFGVFGGFFQKKSPCTIHTGLFFLVATV